MYHIGFTGTRQGMSPKQLEALNALLAQIYAAEDDVAAHHGDCIGADAQFHSICHGLNIPVSIHPPIFDTYRAHCTGYATKYPAKSLLDRNDDIVAAANHLIVAPFTIMEINRSGTWYTKRQAERTETAFTILNR